MSFNFDELINRRNNNSIKWTQYDDSTLPMWIADMDFTAPKEVIDGLAAIIQNGVYGYAKERPTRLLDAIIYRMYKLYNWKIDEESIILLPNLVSGMNIAGRMVRQQLREASVITSSPLYPPILAMAENQTLRNIDVSLGLKIQGQELYYELDFDAIEKAIAEDSKLFMLCQPHNPVGRIFRYDELLQLEAIANKHDLIVVSDEIHAELTLDDHKNTPYALVSKRAGNHTITLFSASKTFNLAGLGGGFAIIENEKIRKDYLQAMRGIVPNLTVISMKAMELAFDYGDEWLVALKRYLTGNRDYLVNELSTISHLRYTKPEATYLMWLDFSETSLGKDAFNILLENKLALNAGASFGANNAYVRLNFACPRFYLTKAVEKIMHCLES